MKALMCHELTGIDALRVEEVPEPVAGAKDVVISVRAAGVNFPDVLLVKGQYQFKAPLPFAAGFELAGVAKAVGAEVKHVKVGDHVLALVSHGAFAQEVAAPAERVMPLPKSIDLELAAAMMFTYGTSHYALKDRGELKAGETLLVLGAAGGVGLAAVELGKIMGARVIAAASSAEKLEVCKAAGADVLIDYSREDLKERLKAVGKIDVVYDPVGGAYTETAFRALAWKGRLLVIGFAAGDIPKIPLNLPLLKGASIVGVFWGAFMQNEPEASRANAIQLVKWLAEGKIKPHISNRYPLDKGVEALREVQDRRAKGKVLVIPA